MKTLLLAAAASCGLLTTAAMADDFHVARNWYADGGFTVEQVFNDTRGSQFCTMRRGGQGQPMIAITLNPDGMQLLLGDPEKRWTPGSTTLLVDGRPWTAQALVDPSYPEQLKFDIARGPQLLAFMTAMSYGQILTVASPGKYGSGGFHYDVSLTGSAAALQAEMNCTQAIGNAPVVQQPRFTSKTIF
jgi:hypothetical protein